MRVCSAAALIVALAGCGRPLVDPLGVTLEVAGPDLMLVQVEPTLALDLRVVGATAGAEVTVGGERASFDAARGLFQDTLRLDEGLNVIPVAVTDLDRVIQRDTLYAFHLRLQASLGAALPPLPRRAGASVSRLPDGATLIAGGLDASGPSNQTARLDLDGTVTPGTLALARLGHTATRLPSGETLLLGGALSLRPSMRDEFVTSAELLARDGTPVRTVPIEGGMWRVGHTTHLQVDREGAAYLHVYGGWDGAGLPVDASGTVVILSWTADGRLVRLTPPAGAGIFARATYATTWDDVGDPTRAAVLTGEADEAFRFVWREPGAIYPFDLRAEPLGGLRLPRRAPAAVDLSPLLGGGEPALFVAGGVLADGRPTATAEIYLPRRDLAFRLPDGVRLSVPRAHAYATIFPSRRIAVVGGLDGPASSSSSAADVFFF